MKCQSPFKRERIGVNSRDLHNVFSSFEYGRNIDKNRKNNCYCYFGYSFQIQPSKPRNDRECRNIICASGQKYTYHPHLSGGREDNEKTEH